MSGGLGRRAGLSTRELGRRELGLGLGVSPHERAERWTGERGALRARLEVRVGRMWGRSVRWMDFREGEWRARERLCGLGVWVGYVSDEFLGGSGEGGRREDLRENKGITYPTSPLPAPSSILCSESHTVKIPN